MKNLQKGFAVPIIIAIVALLAIGGGYVYVNNKAEAPSVTLPDITNNVPTSTQIVGGDKDIHVGDWKQYKNDSYGFEISIPIEWSVKISEGKVCCGDTSVSRFFIGVNPFLNGMDRGLSIYVYDRNNKQYDEVRQGGNMALAVIRSQNEVNKFSENPEKCIAEHIKDIIVGVSNLPAVEVYDAKNDCFQNIYEFVIRGNGFDYKIDPWPVKGINYVGYDGKLEVQKTLPEFNRILSSFKLI